MIGKHVGTIDLPMQRLAVIKGRQEFTLVPWQPELLKMRGKEIDIGHARSHNHDVACARTNSEPRSGLQVSPASAQEWHCPRNSMVILFTWKVF
jgi:Protein of unknown function (DUF3363)